jgi:hypothetical protein
VVFSGLRWGRPSLQAVHTIKGVTVNEVANCRKWDAFRVRLMLRAFIRNIARLFTDVRLVLVASPGTATTVAVSPAVLGSCSASLPIWLWASRALSNLVLQDASTRGR